MTNPIQAVPEINIDGRECLVTKMDDLWNVIEFNYQLRSWVTLARSHFKEEAISDDACRSTRLVSRRRIPQARVSPVSAECRNP